VWGFSPGKLVGRAYDWVAINVCGSLLLRKGALVQVVWGLCAIGLWSWRHISGGCGPMGLRIGGLYQGDFALKTSVWGLMLRG